LHVFFKWPLSVVSALIILAIMVPAVVLADMRLIMMTSDYCPFCRAWERDVGVIYYKSPYAAHLPLTRIDIGTEIPSEMLFKTPVKGTPTFIILQQNEEIDRIQGYDSAEMFWWWLSEHAPK